MKIIIVPGNSPKNKKWIQKATKFFQSNKGYDVLSIEYSHWHSKEDLIDIEKESLKLNDLLSGQEKYLIIAKSAGILVSIKTFMSGKINPKSFIFLGLPLGWTKERKFNISLMFNEFPIPALIIQNKKDPVASADEVNNFIQKLKNPRNIQLIQTPGNSHDYEDFELIYSFINKI
jgi:hypothetical protein